MHRIAVLILIFAAAAAANSPVVLQDFGIGNLDGGSSLYAGLVMDTAGNLYGAAEEGGIYNAGVVYELSRNTGGGWTETVLYNFTGANRGQDGANPHATLLRDSAGNLYGTTVSGGIASRTCSKGCGVVFKLTPSGDTWQETVLYRFTGGADGSVPYAGVSMDAAGNLYGAATSGGATAGVVYELTPGTPGWTEAVIHTFEDVDGATPYGTPVLDAAGNLFGTTYAGGAYNRGVVYALTPSAGAWTFHALHNFRGSPDGANTLTGVILGPRGTLFGTTTSGGTASCGIAYELAFKKSAGWTETILHTFLGVGAADGENPNGLILDAHGNLFGTSTGGGLYNPGTIFELSPMAGGGWQETVLYSFTAGLDGAYPSSSLTLGPSGHLFGTTLWGGPSGDTTGGVAFEFTP
ncbi:MAG TPA: choice-of-anchor tandem repeat GloVer-containing protein [Bryobacteraceae bacterium]|nr:choice-of-anchor tandem repeat GloVer-containing protein [Bryobacteraceae bacterium]